MHNRTDSANEWNIVTNVGPILFNIIINSSFFNYSSHQSSEMHRHATFELHFIMEGSGVLYTDDSQYEICLDSYYLIRAGIYHKQKGEDSDPIHRISCKFEFDISNSADSEYSEEEIKSFVYILSNTPFFYSRNLNSIKPVIYEIQSELRQKSLGYYMKVKVLFSLMFIIIMREISQETKYEFKAQPPAVESHLGNRMSIIENFFDSSYDYKPTSKQLCELIHLSSSQLNRFLKKKYNMTFKQKHIERQIEYSKDMLINSNAPIREIAERIGYASEGNFTAFFKQVLGVSPKVYRKQHQLPPGIPTEQ